MSRSRECRHERGAHGAFGEQIANEVGDAERHDEGVHVVARAEDGGEHLIAEQAENPADERRGAGQAGRAGEERADALRVKRRRVACARAR